MTTATAARGRRAAVVGLWRGSSTWGWALVSMGLSSVTSFGLSVVAGRALGASGLGVVFAGFTAYVMLLTFHRSLVTTPLVSSSSALPASDQAGVTRAAVTVSLAIAAASSLGLVVGSIVVGGRIGHGLLLFAPWLVPAFAQDLARSSLVRDGRAGIAAASDLVWLGAFASCAVVAVELDVAWAVVGSWGIGATAAAATSALALGYMPARARSAWAWFTTGALPFGRWLALQEGSFMLGFFAIYMALATILGVTELGGLRAAESVFAPFTLLAPALTLAGLPALARASAASHAAAVRLAVRVSVLCVGLTLLYAALMVFAGARILTAVFGEGFERYGTLVYPMLAGQVALAVGVGFAILVRAQQRGMANLVIGLAMVTSSFACSVALAAYAGLEGAVWGLSIGAAVATVSLVAVSLRPRSTLAVE